MFSKYKRSGGKPDAAAETPEAPVKAKAQAPEPETASQGEPPVAARKPQELSAVPKADLSGGDDKEAKRRLRLDELKTEMHHRLLDNLNLSALESAKESELRAEINAITSEQLADAGFHARRSLPYRIVRFPLRLLHALATARWMRLAAYTSYACGYIWAWCTARRLGDGA